MSLHVFLPVVRALGLRPLGVRGDLCLLVLAAVATAALPAAHADPRPDVATVPAALVPPRGSSAPPANGAPTPTDGSVRLTAAAAADAVQPSADPDVQVDKRTHAPTEPTTNWTQLSIRYGTLVGIPVLTFIYGQRIWDWGTSDGWRWADEGWFSTTTPHGGSDKVGHGFSHYLLTRTSKLVFDYTEDDDDRATWFAVSLAFAIGLGIEIGDAFTGAYGFSMQDMLADSTGIGLALLFESFPVVDGLVGVSMEYFPTDAFRRAVKRSWLAFEGDTSGYTYMLNFKPAGLRALGVDVPTAVGLTTLDVGYYTRGFTWFDEVYEARPRTRYWFVGMSLSVPELIDLAFDRRPHPVNKSLKQVFGHFHLPVGYKHSTAID